MAWKFWKTRKSRRTKPAADPVEKRCASIAELRKAVGPWYWRTEWIDEHLSARTLTPTQESVALMMSLVTFDGYELFPARKDSK